MPGPYRARVFGILGKIESVSGTDAVPVAGTDAIKIAVRATHAQRHSA